MIGNQASSGVICTPDVSGGLITIEGAVGLATIARVLRLMA